MWAYPQMYYFESEQVFNLFKPRKSKRKERKDSQQLFSYEFNNPARLITLPQQEAESNWIEQAFELGGAQLGRVMVSTGLALLVPEGTEVFAPITLVDEVVGFTLIVGGVILQLVY